MNILTVGDSFTYGEELVNLKHAWPYILANKCGGSVQNMGQPASSNDKIVRKTISEVLLARPDNPYDLVVVGWTSPGRMEFADELGVYDIWPGYAGRLFLQQGHNWRVELCEYIGRYHNSKYFHEKFLNQVILLQSFFKCNNIKYVMVNVLQNEYYKKQYFDDLPELYGSVDKEYFLGFNHEGMCEWAHGCQKGPAGHFLDQGHQIVADKIYEHIRHLGWLS